MMNDAYPNADTDERYRKAHGHYPNADNTGCSRCRNELLDLFLD